MGKSGKNLEKKHPDHPRLKNKLEGNLESSAVAWCFFLCLFSK